MSYKNFVHRLFILAFIAITATSAMAANKKLSVPRFVTIKANEVNARSGPAIKSPTEWVFVKKGEPVEIIAEYEQWRQIRDIKGEGGWVHLSVLSGKRSVIVVSPEPISLVKAEDAHSRVVALVHPQVRCQLSKCKDDWCRVRCSAHEGWLPRKSLWGVYGDEKF